MSTVAERAAPAGAPVEPARRRPDWRRIPYWAHVVLAAVIVLLSLAVAGHGSIINADEGAALSQSRVLSELGDWGMPNPNPGIDPEGRWFPIEMTAESGDAWYPYTKHVTYLVAVTALREVGGVALVLVTHGLALVAAGALVGLVTRQVARRHGQPEHLDRVALWVLVVGTPAAFDAHWVIAHAPALAAAALATLGVVLAGGAERRRPALGGALAVAGTLAAVLLRSEGTLFGLALAGAVGLWWLASPRTWQRFVTAGLVGGTTVGAYFADGLLDRAVRPGGGAPFRIVHDEGFWRGRIEGFSNSVLRPDLAGEPIGTVLVLVGTAATLAAWVLLRRDPRLAQRASILGAAALVLRAILSDALVPGLAMAAPVVVAGLCTIGRPVLRDRLSRTLLLTAAAYTLLVMATQYAAGGTGDWGGRYFRLLLVVVVPVVVVALRARLDRTEPQAARVMVAALTIGALALTMAGLRYVRHSSALLERTVTDIHAEAAEVGQGRPVVVALPRAFGRFSWEHLWSTEMLHVRDPADLPEVAVALDADGVTGVLLVADDDEMDRVIAGLAPNYEPVPADEVEPSGWATLAFRRAG